MQAFFEVNQIAALAQPHFLGETGNLIQIGREISDSPNAGLREIVKFHASAQSACRKYSTLLASASIIRMSAEVTVISNAKRSH